MEFLKNLITQKQPVVENVEIVNEAKEEIIPVEGSVERIGNTLFTVDTLTVKNKNITYISHSFGTYEAQYEAELIELTGHARDGNGNYKFDVYFQNPVHTDAIRPEDIKQADVFVNGGQEIASDDEDYLKQMYLTFLLKHLDAIVQNTMHELNEPEN